MSILYKEWRWVACVTFFVMCVTIFPYVYGVVSAPKDKVFTGVHAINPVDTYTYLAWIEQAREGKLLFKDLYTSEPQQATLFHPPSLAMGAAASMTGLPNIFIYHATRAILGVIFLFVAYLFISLFFQEIFLRKIAFLLMATSAGLGAFVGSLSIDLWVTEAITFLSLYESVLNTLSLTLILLIFFLIQTSFERRSMKAPLYAGLLLNLLVLTHPYDLLIVAAVAGANAAYRCWRDRRDETLYNTLLMLLFAFPSILWHVHALMRNTAFSRWAFFQTSVPSVPAVYMILGYGIPLLFAVAGAVLVFRRKQVALALPVIWLASCSALLYLPFLSRFQRKFSEGLHIPMALLAAVGLTWWAGKFSMGDERLKKFVVAAVIVFCSLTNVNVITRDIRAFQTQAYPYYISKPERAAMHWLKENVRDNEVVLSGVRLGNLIPGVTGRTVFMGHNDQTMDIRRKYESIRTLFASGVSKHGDPWPTFLEMHRIDYLFLDQELRSFGTVDLAKPYLSLEYENVDVAIYRIDNLPPESP